MKITEQVLSIDRMENAVELFGSFDENIRLIEDEYSVRVTVRGDELKISGADESVFRAQRVIEGLLSLLNKGESLSEQNVRYCISLVNEGSEEKIDQLAGDCICITSKGRPVKPKTIGQKRYCNCIRDNIILYKNPRIVNRISRVFLNLFLNFTR